MDFSIFTAFPRGYCAGVHRAVGMLMKIIATYEPPIYVNHEIIHNSYVVKMFERKGVIFEDNIENIPEGSLVVISAHGIGPSYFERLRARKIRWIDATCPLVEKVHREARDYIAKGYHILYIGKKGHQEAMGVIDEGEKYFTLIEKIEDLEDLSSSLEHFAQKSKQVSLEQGGMRKIALLTQTTLSVDDTEGIIHRAKEIFPDLVLPKTGDICYATTNRQKAVKVLTEKCNCIFVVGSKTSSNSNKLRHVAESQGIKAYLIDDASEIQEDWLEGVRAVGITAGASGPEELVEGVVRYLELLGGRFDREIRVVEEKMEFPYILKVNQ